MAKAPTFDTITAGFASAAKLNSNFAAISTSFQNTLSLDGSTPNAMLADFDLNSNDILNGGDASFTDITIAGLSLMAQVNAAAASAAAAAASAAIVASLTEFTNLTDTPANYSGAANKFVKVNAGATALEFVSGGGSEPSDGDKGDITVSASGLTWTIDAGVIGDTEVSTISATNISITDTGAFYVGSEVEAALQEVGAFLALKAPLASPSLTGSPTAPTQTASDNSTKIATTAYVDSAVAAGVSPTWSESFTTALTDCNSVIPIDGTDPLITEGVQIASIASVVVGSGEQVELNIDTNIASAGDNNIVVTLWRGSTLIAVRSAPAITFVEAAQNLSFHYLDSPTAATYTYTLRVGISVSAACYLNARNTTTPDSFSTAMKSGMRLKVV